MQILFNISSINGFIFSTVYGVFAILAKVYDFFISITSQYKSWDYINLKTFGTMMYILAGIFMLFRVTVSLIQMLVNPDLVSDSNVGTGKLLTRIITVILMLVIFMPNGLIFGSDGILNRLELAVTDSSTDESGHQKGLVYRILDNTLATNMTKEELDELYAKQKREYLNARFLEKQQAAENGFKQKLTNENIRNGMVCYYLDISIHGEMNGKSGWKIPKMYKIAFYDNEDSGKNKIEGTKFSYTSLNDEINAIVWVDDYGDEQIAMLDEFPLDIKDGGWNGWNKGAFNKDFPSSCPKRFEERISAGVVGYAGHYYVAQTDFIDGDDIRDCNDYSETQTGGGIMHNCENKGIIGGFEREEDVVNFLKGLNESERDFVYQKNWKGEQYTSANIAGDTRLLTNIDDERRFEVMLFVRNIAKSFQECSDYDITKDLSSSELDEYCITLNEKNKGECSCLQRQQFETVQANERMIELMNANKLEVSFLASVIAGIAIAVYLLFLIVEIIIRRLKLVLLEMIAPIPIICYANPKDKVFEQWIKMYISTYVDLFIKLFSISFGIYLLKYIQAMGPKGFFGTIAYIIAILIFMKAIPTMLSKLTGLDNLGGSFKDIFNLTRKGLGAATGVGMNVGANTIRTLGNFGAAASAGHWGTAAGSLVRGGLGTIGSALTGAGAGWNGKGRQAASNTLQRGNIERKALASGASWSAVSWEGTKKRFGFDTTYEAAEAREKDDKVFIQEMDASKEMALKIANKEVGAGNTSITEFNVWKQAKDDYQTAMVTGVGLAKAESALKKAEGKVFERVMTDLHNDTLGNYTELTKRNSRGQQLDLTKAKAQASNMENAASGIGISKRKLYKSNLFQKDYKDEGELDQIKQQQTMREHAATQGLVNFNNQNRGH